MTEAEFQALCQEKGYGDIITKSYEANGYDAQHTHDRSIIAMVLEGELTLEWEVGETRYQPGDVCEFSAGTLHAEKIGPEGARIMVGFK